MKKIFIPLLIGLLATSCTTLYHPQLEAIPLVEEQGELTLESGLSHQDAFAGNISVSYGLTDKVALQGFARTNQTDGVRNFHGMVAAGLYGKNDNGLIREAYVGLAGGMNTANWGSGSTALRDQEGNTLNLLDDFGDQATASAYWHFYNGSYQMLYVQGNIGKRKKHFEWALGLKIGGLHSLIDHDRQTYDFSSPNDLGVYQDYYTEPEANPFNSGRKYNNFSILIQPQLELRFGWEHFKFTWRIADAMLCGLPKDINRTFMGHFNSGLGIMYRF